MKVGIYGHGRIGKAVFKLIAGFDTIEVAWIKDINGIHVFNDNRLHSAEVVVNCAPWHQNRNALNMATSIEAHYIDFSEDPYWFHGAVIDPKRLFIPHCGIAPGAISVLGKRVADMGAQDITLQVGALPQREPDTAMHHLVTWSPEGMAHEYYGECEIIGYRRRQTVPALFSVLEQDDGLEAAVTKGGLGTLAKTLDGKVDNLGYFTLRYPGHWSWVKACKKGGMTEPEMARMFNDYPLQPGHGPDKVVVRITADDQKLEHTILPAHGLTAIEYATASGGCVVLDMMANGWLPESGIVRQEDIRPVDYFTSVFAEPFVPLLT